MPRDPSLLLFITFCVGYIVYISVKSFFLNKIVGCKYLMEIIEGVHRVDEASANMAHANVYLVINGKELAVIDTGTSGNAQKTVEYIKKIGYQPGDVKTIILTHFHMDHMGSAKELKDLTNAKVAVHTEDADYVSGKKPPAKTQKHLVQSRFILRQTCTCPS